MEEQMLEETNEEVDNEVENTEEATQEETAEIIAENEVEEEQPEKLFTQAQVDELMKNREARAYKKAKQEYKDSLSKLNELAYLNQKGLQANNLDETLEKTREFYGKQGIKYIPETDNADEEILGKHDANEIISDANSLEDLELEAARLSKKQNLSYRENIVLQSLNEEITNKKRISGLRAIGVTEDEYNSQSFIDFEKQFTKDTPIEKIYQLFKLSNTTVKPVANPGSMKTTPGKEKRSYYSSQEVDRMSKEELIQNMDVIRDSMTKWK